MSEYEKEIIKTYNLSNDDLQAIKELFKSLAEIAIESDN